MKKIYFLIFLLFFNSYLFATKSEDIAKSWADRAYIAEGRIKNDKNLKGYEYLLEFAYAMHYSKNDLVQKHELGIDYYKIILKSDTGLFVITYSYNNKTGNLIFTRIESLPKKWYLLSLWNFDEYIVLDLNDNGKCIFFNKKDPFDTKIVDFKEQK